MVSRVTSLLGRRMIRLVALSLGHVSAWGEGVALGCFEMLTLPKYPALLRASRRPLVVECTARGDGSGAVRCTASDRGFARVAGEIAEGTRLAAGCARGEAVSFRVWFRVLANEKEEFLRYGVQSGEFVVAIGPVLSVASGGGPGGAR